MQDILSFEGNERHPYCLKCGSNLETSARNLDEDKPCPHIRLNYSDFTGEVVYCHYSLDDQIMKAGGYGSLNTADRDHWLFEHELESIRGQDGEVRDVHPVETNMK